MNGLPPSVPLPSEVRERALQTVLAGMDAPPRSRAPFVAAAAAAVVAVVVSTVVAISGSGPADLRPPASGLPATTAPAAASGLPATTGDTVTDPALLRCAAAVEKSGRARSYPPTSGWRATEVLLHTQSGETVIAIDDAFACFVGSYDVWLTATRGTPVGSVEAGVEFTQLTPAIQIILNPKRRAVTVPPGAGTIAQAPTAPVLLVDFGLAGSGAGFPIDVAGSYEGPLPAAAPIGVVVQDREPQTRAPEPTGDTTLDECVAGSMPGAQRGLRHEIPGSPPAVAATVGDGYGGFCVAGSGAPAFAAGDIPPVGVRSGPVVVAAVVRGGVTGVLVAVPLAVTRVEITAGGAGALCSLQDGLALCTLPGTSAASVTAFDVRGTGTRVALN